MDDIGTKILKFHAQLEGNGHHRYKSWEHCYTYFIKDKIDADTACLQIAFYPASWGMYRDSSFLLWKDYLVHKDVVDHLLNNKHLQKLDFIDTTDEEIKEIFDLICWVKSWYRDKIDFVNGKRRKVNVTDTLATKILLGALGCVPAYDRYFIGGIRSKGLSYSCLKPDNLSTVANFYKRNHSSFSCAKNEIWKLSGVSYPPMKLVDMYFWGIGY